MGSFGNIDYETTSHSIQSADVVKIASAPNVTSHTIQCDVATSNPVDDKNEKVPSEELLSELKTSTVNDDENSLPLANK